MTTKFILVYTGGTMPTAAAEYAALMRAWRVWVGGLGGAVLDPGNPFGPARTIAPDDTVRAGGPSELRGYLIFTADDLAAATELAKGCPHRTVGGTIEVYEALPIP